MTLDPQGLSDWMQHWASLGLVVGFAWRVIAMLIPRKNTMEE